MKLFIDTNILLDVLLRRDPFHRASGEIWRWAEETGDGCVSAISFTNGFYVLRKALGKDRAWEALRRIRPVFQTIDLTTSVLDRAIALGLPDFEDAVQIASAESVDAVLIVTRDVTDFAASSVSAVTPEVALTSLRGG